MKSTQLLIVGGLLLIIAGLSLGGAPPGIAQAQTPAATRAATRAALPPITEPLGQPPSFLAKYYQAWVASPHAKVDAEAFVHWNKEGRIPADCATCHSTPGYLDFMGENGTAFGKVDADAPVGSVVNCDACHNNRASNLNTVTFPSGATVTGMGDSTRCMVCHQGRSSTVQVNAAIEKAGLAKEVNKVSPDLRFINIHYYAAAASVYGSEAKGGYEFAGKLYQRRYTHVDGYNTCAGCHDSHTLQVRVTACASCHDEVKTAKDLRNIRMQGSLTDYDGDGDIEEGIADELTSLQEMLYKTMQAYASKVAGKAIAYDSATYPYFFIDTNTNGKVDKEEAVATNGFNAFTARLLQAAYNYQVTIKDPGNYAHNAAYHIELLYDSIEALNKEMGTAAADMAQIQRNDPGHFDATSEAFRHWDKEGDVPGACAKCHTAEGLPVFLKNNANIAIKPSTSLSCTTCHDKIPDFTVRAVEKVTFPSGAVLTLGKKEADNLCLNCHQGRESTVSVNNAIKAAGVDANTVSDKLTFRNVHYFAAGASLFGTEAKGAYEYEGKQYNGRFLHEEPFQTCSDCHDTHALRIQLKECTRCHENIKAPSDIRGKDNKVDYNGNGKTDEPIAAEIATLREELLKRIYAYATKTAGASIVYESHTHPYWYIDTNSNGQPDADEIKAENRFVKWTPNLLRAAYNYQFASKDPGAFAHNAGYTLQVLYDSIESIGGKEAVANFKRPDVVASK